MPRGRVFRNNFSAGELDPQLLARTDLKAYDNGLERARNVLLLSGGGVERRPGLRFIKRLPNIFTRVTPAVVSTPNGGSNANVSDGNLGTVMTTTTPIGVLDPYVVVHYDLGSAKPIIFADYTALEPSAGAVAAFVIQASNDDATWTNIGTYKTITAGDPLSRRWNHINGIVPLSFRYWRLIRDGATNHAGVIVSLSGFNLYEETATISPVRIVPFQFSLLERYLLYFTDNSIMVMRGGTEEIVANVISPIHGAALSTMTWAQSFDTLILCQKDIVTQVLIREGDHDEWTMGNLAFDGIPEYDFDDADSPTPVSWISDIEFVPTPPENEFDEEHPFEENDQYQLDLDGIPTEIIFFAANDDLNRQRIQRALRNHPLIVNRQDVDVTINGSNDFRVTISGRSAEDFPELIGDVIVGLAKIETVLIQEGSSPKEPVWSVLRGFPATVCFHQQRLWFGGSESRPDTLWGSRVGEFFDFGNDENLPDEGIDVTLSSDEVATILQLHSGRHLQVFTSTGEFHIPDEPITPENMRAILDTQHGIFPGLRVFDVHGATLFVQKNGKAIREFLFSVLEEAYSGTEISILSSHLIRSPVGIAYRPDVSASKASYVLLVNEDGTLTVLNTLREQELAGWSHCYGRGLFRDVAVNGNGMFFAVQREIDGADVLYIERFTLARLLDSSIKFDGLFGTQTTFTGLDHLEGETVQAYADGSLLTPVVVIGGEVTLERAPVKEVEIGLDFANGGDEFEIQLLPLELQLPEGTPVGRKKRIVEMTLRLQDSKCGVVNGIRIPYKQLDSPLFLDHAVQTFTGDKTLEGFLGWDEFGRVTITDTKPLPFRLLGIALEVAI